MASATIVLACEEAEEAATVASSRSVAVTGTFEEYLEIRDELLKIIRSYRKGPWGSETVAQQRTCDWWAVVVQLILAGKARPQHPCQGDVPIEREPHCLARRRGLHAKQTLRESAIA